MKKMISLLLIVCTVLTLLPCASAASLFSDVSEENWFYDSVKYVSENGLMLGTSDTAFSPRVEFSRAMLVTVLWRICDEPTASNSSFSDVSQGKWYSSAVYWGYESGIITGYGNGLFGPNDPVTREQMVTIFSRYAEMLGLDVSEYASLKSYADADKISGWAEDSVAWAVKISLIKGVDGNMLAPLDTATRAEAATVLQRFCVYIDSPETEDTPDIGDSEQTGETQKPGESEQDDGTQDLEPTDEIEKSALLATQNSAFSSESEVILNQNKQINTSVLPSFDIDETAFVRSGTKLSDLKGKSLVLFTTNAPKWYYYDGGKRVSEWDWFRLLKDELGLFVKYTTGEIHTSLNNAIKYMNIGKQMDIIYADGIIYPSVLSISSPLTEYININDDGSSPGISKRAMDITKWGGSYRVIAPVGNIDVLWYNETMSMEMGLSNPHTLWKNGGWNWDSFQSYVYSAPFANHNGEKLIAFANMPTSLSFVFPSTTGTPYMYIDSDASVPTIINNWEAESTLEAWEFITTVCNNVNFSASEDAYYDLYEGKTLMAGTMRPQEYFDTEYSKNIQLNWVPYPKSTGKNGTDTAQFLGTGMLLPKKTTHPENIDIALKFMELWATRFTESIFDNLRSYEYYSFNYKQRKEYYDYCESMTFALQMNNFSGSDIATDTNFFKCFTGNPSYDVKTEAVAASDIVNDYILDSLLYGINL